MKKEHSILFFRSLKFVFTILLFTVPFTACPADPLDTWIGTYSFGEYGPPDSLIVMEYEIQIYRENDGYFATIEIDGYQTMTRIKAKVIGNHNSIDFIFEEYLPDNMFEPYSNGDKLMSFERKDGGFITNWHKMTLRLTEESLPGEYFKQTSE